MKKHTIEIKNISAEKQELRILQLTDLHFDDGECENDKKTIALLDAVIPEAKPDIIIITGDFVTCDLNTKHAPVVLRHIYKHGIPWAYVWGNHDTEYGEGYREMIEAVSTLPNCINPKTQEGISGHSNFVLGFGQEGREEWLLIGLDSGAYNANELIGGYDFVKSDQIDWYKQVIDKRREKDERFAALCFMHIALPEYNIAKYADDVYGKCNEEICCPRQNSGLFSAMLEKGHTRGVFVGHDHINDFEGTLYGICLCFGRCGGFNTYGKKGYPRGARLITIRRDNTKGFSTKCYLEGRHAISQISEEGLRYKPCDMESSCPKSRKKRNIFKKAKSALLRFFKKN